VIAHSRQNACDIDYGRSKKKNRHNRH